MHWIVAWVLCFVLGNRLPSSWFARLARRKQRSISIAIQSQFLHISASMTTPKKHRKIKDLPSGVSDLTGAHFRKKVKARLKSDWKRQAKRLRPMQKMWGIQNCGLDNAAIGSSEDAVHECWCLTCQQLNLVSLPEGTLGYCQMLGAERKGWNLNYFR